VVNHYFQKKEENTVVAIKMKNAIHVLLESQTSVHT